ncbi:cytochrome P450 302a1, mitochondrial-like [Oppia nitens]|uniref:cytochrome P450 302a1, mitochondrial-like n=1 Tax=Oppia nitens TaxID=1686743 RepID=UPI0023DBB745|nr:cytochrome P450 302a1, mitochondrial-like [Oppia nitens]
MKTVVNVLNRLFSRSLCSSVTTNCDKPSVNALKSFDAIPGPKPVPLFGNKWRYLPIIGEYRVDEMDVNGEIRLKKFGKVVREVLDKDLTIVHVFDPKDIEAVFRQEGKYPLRRSHRALLKYRKDRPHRYASGGLFPENGQQWYSLRKQFQHHLLNATNVSTYIADCEDITIQLIDYIRSKRDINHEISDFLNDLYLWSLENTGVLALDSRLGCLNTNLSEDSDAKLMIRAAHETNDAVMRTERTDAWFTKDTSDYQMLVSAQDAMTNIIDKYMNQKTNESLNTDLKKDKTIFAQLLNNPNVDRKDLFAMIVDLFVAGIDTTAFTAGFALYHLSRNTTAQNRLRDEINSILKSDCLTADNLSQMSYLKACVKETMRLSPVTFGNGRVTSQQMIINDYCIPKGTQIITQNQVSCRQSEYFSDPLSFIPERWLKSDTNIYPNNKVSPFLVLPFGYGPRMCIGRRFAEMEINVFLAKIIQNYRIEYHYEDIKVKTRLINVPDKPLKFKFVDII